MKLQGKVKFSLKLLIGRLTLSYTEEQFTGPFKHYYDRLEIFNLLCAASMFDGILFGELRFAVHIFHSTFGVSVSFI